ncbi:hypothetical protein V3C99_012020 [Haemonchus contortus]
MIELLMQLLCFFGSISFVSLCVQPREEKSIGRMPVSKNPHEGSAEKVDKKNIAEKMELHFMTEGQADPQIVKKTQEKNKEKVTKNSSKDAPVISSESAGGSGRAALPQTDLALLAAAEKMALEKGDYDTFGPPGKHKKHKKKGK